MFSYEIDRTEAKVCCVAKCIRSKRAIVCNGIDDDDEAVAVSMQPCVKFKLRWSDRPTARSFQTEQYEANSLPLAHTHNVHYTQ